MKLRRKKKQAGDLEPILDMGKSRERESSLTKRRKSAWWDRVKILLLLGFIFFVLYLQELGDNPNTMQLRYLQTLSEIATENSSSIVFPIPIDILKPFYREAAERAAEGGDRA